MKIRILAAVCAGAVLGLSACGGGQDLLEKSASQSGSAAEVTALASQEASGEVNADEPEPAVLEIGREDAVPGSFRRELVISGQTFSADISPLGELTFISCMPDREKSPAADASFWIQREGEYVRLEDMAPDNIRDDGVFNQVEAVGFKDWSGDGAQDIITVCSYRPLRDAEDGAEFWEVRLYKNRADGRFTLWRELSYETSDACAAQGITVDGAAAYALGEGRTKREQDFALRTGMDYGEAVQEVRRMFEAVSSDDRAYVAGKIDYPVRLEIPGGEVSAEGTRDFLSYYDALFTEDFKNKLTKEDPEDLLADDGRVGVGEGSCGLIPGRGNCALSQ